MIRASQALRASQLGLPRRLAPPGRFFASFPPTQPCQTNPDTNCRKSHEKAASPAALPPSRSVWDSGFWTCRSTWKRAGINTLRCLVGYLGMGLIMGASMASGITTSILVETILLRRGVDQLSWSMAARTAMGMSMVSMLAMEAAENLVDYHLTGGVVDVGDPQFWMAAAVSMTAGYMAPLPYNYLRLRKYGKACH
ncbi:hypothetical protein HFD88_010380 [Aspergillus terreus]|nr:hypothetical protein HFD88_010380 [Aspergillus terreus]